jgi:uncharacterized protein (UPF0371 family)
MPPKRGFDNDKYLSEQTASILERVKASDNKLYLEFGGKLLFDMHASRVLPGFDPCVKMRLLQNLKDKADIILCIFAGDIERKKVRADFGITYDADAVKLIDDLKEWGIVVAGVVITRFESQPAACIFKNKLERRGIRVYTHRIIRGYPTDVEHIVSDEGFGQNPYIETRMPLVVVTGPGPNSGKLSTCLSQLFHEYRRGVQAGYAKFETFPIWNLPLMHPVNVAYEAATADILDFNLIDPHHLKVYGKTAVNYNRDVEVFPVLKRILETITGAKSIYQSPTDMGVNRAGFGIVDDEAVQEAARQEVIRRYFRSACEYAMGFCEQETVRREEFLLQELGIKPEDRTTVLPARNAAQEAARQGKGNEGIHVGAALELPDGSIITGKNSALMHAASSTVLNAIKALADLPDRIHLLAPNVIDAVGAFKRDTFASRNVSLSLDEALTALAISATTNPVAQEAVAKLRELRGCEMHITHLPTSGDEAGLRRLGVNLTSEPNFASKNLSE